MRRLSIRVVQRNRQQLACRLLSLRLADARVIKPTDHLLTDRLGENGARSGSVVDRPQSPDHRGVSERCLSLSDVEHGVNQQLGDIDTIRLTSIRVAWGGLPVGAATGLISAATAAISRLEIGA